MGRLPGEVDVGYPGAPAGDNEVGSETPGARWRPPRDDGESIADSRPSTDHESRQSAAKASMDAGRPENRFNRTTLDGVLRLAGEAKRQRNAADAARHWRE